MDHVAFMKKEWGFIDKILVGTKTIESRWYKNKYRPWGVIKKGEIIYFKNSGEPITVKAIVDNVMMVSNLDVNRVEDLLEKYGDEIGIEKNDFVKFLKKFQDKKYCILIFIKNPKKIVPFSINKKGFGLMASWISVSNINEIQQIS